MFQIKNVSKCYKDDTKKQKKFYAVNNVSLDLQENMSYALVGESGSGKSTLSRILSFVEKPDNGQVILDDSIISSLNKRELLKKRRCVQLVMQNGKSSLDPHKTIKKILIEALVNLLDIDKKEAGNMIVPLLNKVGLMEEIANRYPRELSGGQLKRVCIARAVCSSPKYIIFDESLSSLDVTLRKQILDFLLDLKKQIRCTYLFITHDLDLALYAANHILVMKEGKIVEKIYDVKELDDFLHPYSLQLVESMKFKQQALL